MPAQPPTCGVPSCAAAPIGSTVTHGPRGWTTRVYFCADHAGDKPHRFAAPTAVGPRDIWAMVHWEPLHAQAS